MITQTDVLEFLTQDPSLSKELKSLLGAPALEIAERAYRRRGPSDLSTDPNQSVTVPRHPHVLTVHSDFETWSAFKLLYRHRVPALAVVDPSSKSLIECLSATDFRGLDLETLQNYVFLPVAEFLERISSKMKMEMKRELVTCKPNEPLEKVLKKVSLGGLILL
jgi:CBS-domain-containing membrane protein